MIEDNIDKITTFESKIFNQHFGRFTKSKYQNHEKIISGVTTKNKSTPFANQEKKVICITH
jgi:hypothetical protein